MRYNDNTSALYKNIQIENSIALDTIAPEIINDSKRPLIIFPQATRVLPHERPPFKKGAARIYEELKISCQPVAINSGFVWPKKGLKQSNKVITISILKPIIAGHLKKEFIKILENDIYKELNLLN